MDAFFAQRRALTGSNSELQNPMAGMAHRWDKLLERCRGGDVVAAVYETSDALQVAKNNAVSMAHWRTIVNEPTFIQLRDSLREDPFTNRAVTRPRGYPGDAVMLDMAYRLIGPDPATTSVGKLAFDATTNSPGSRSVRARKRCVSEFIDDVADEFSMPRIASVACGHLRELAWSDAIRAGKIQEFVGIDQDSDSIAEVKNAFGHFEVTAVQASLKAFLLQQAAPGPYHGMYSVGLFDYLDDATAAKALGGMFQMIAPGGRLLVANLSPSLGDIAYMEAVMDWWMIYRTKEQLQSLAAQVIKEGDAEIRTFQDILGNVAFIEIRRKG